MKLKESNERFRDIDSRDRFRDVVGFRVVLSALDLRQHHVERAVGDVRDLWKETGIETHCGILLVNQATFVSAKSNLILPTHLSQRGKCGERADIFFSEGTNYL